MYINIYVHTSVICTMHSWTLRYLMMCSFLKPKYQKVSACKAFSSNYNVLFMLPLSFQILLSNSWWCIYCTKFPESSGNRLINVFGGQNGSLKNFESISVLGILWQLQICFHITCIFFTSKVMSDDVTVI